MLSKIQKNIRYIEDITKFSKAINLIEDETVKIEATNVLKKLQNEAKYLDNSHEDVHFLKQSANIPKINSSKENIIALKQKLEKLLSKYL